MSVGALVSSCTKDYDYDPATPFSEEGVKVSFVPASNVVLAQSDTEFEVTIVRTETEGELTVPILVESAAEVFTVPSSVTFADGESEAVLVVNVSNDMEAFTDYQLKLTTSDELLDPYTEEQDNFCFYKATVVKEDFKPVAVGLFTDNIFYEASWDVELEYSEMLGLYRLASPFEDGFHIMLNWEKDAPTAVVCDQNGDAQRDTPLGFTYYSYGMVYWTVTGTTQYDAETGLFYFPMAMTVSAGTLANYYETFQITEWY